MSTATLKDVAKFAGVSEATVSRVLNNKTSVDPLLRERVQQAIDQLGYQPNRAARRLRAQSSNVIGLIISDIQNPYFISLIRGIEDAAYAHRMNIILCNSDEDPAKQEIYLEVMQAERVAGLIYVPTPSEYSMIQQIKRVGIPIVLLDRVIDNLALDVVKVDNVRGAYNATKHLLSLGYRRIGAIVNPPELTTGKERFQGYREALQDAGITLDVSLVKYGDSRTESGYAMTRELLASPHRPDAIFAGNNLMTLGALRALHEAHIAIPEEISLVGFDDMPWSGDLCPPLTAVSQPTYELGQEAVHLLLRRIAQPTATYRTVTLETTLIVRESCGVLLRRGKS